MAIFSDYPYSIGAGHTAPVSPGLRGLQETHHCKKRKDDLKVSYYSKFGTFPEKENGVALIIVIKA